ncbi:MAG: transcription-repair coupling factor [Alphaproteobacteria bacterium]|nr:transcription-repair coupling factor [Alphaproteobacteria bacterium]
MMKIIDNSDCKILSGIPEASTAYFLNQLTHQVKKIVFICRDEKRLQQIEQEILFYGINFNLLVFPSWDTVPYDRISPSSDIISKRINTLSFLNNDDENSNTLLLTSIPAILQKLPPKNFFEKSYKIEVGNNLDILSLKEYLANNGYQKTEQVMECGEYAIRGGIIDIFPAGFEEPVRLDLFGDEIESIRLFDPITQITSKNITFFNFKPANEIILNKESISHFRTMYRSIYGVGEDDILYQNISEGKKYPGIENWLPFFYDNLSSLFDFIPNYTILKDYQFEEMLKYKIEQINEFYQARISNLNTHQSDEKNIYRPVPKEMLFMDKQFLEEKISLMPNYDVCPFDYPNSNQLNNIHWKNSRNFFLTCLDKRNIYREISNFIKNENKKIILTAWSKSSLIRLTSLLQEENLNLTEVSSWSEVFKLKKQIPCLIFPQENGFETDDFIIISETDILGERLIQVSPKKKNKKNKNFIRDISTISDGDLIVHIEHGIGKYSGLKTLNVCGALHDCLCLVYQNSDKLYVPVENIEVLSKYGSENTNVTLDVLGGHAWQAKKERLQKKIKEIAEKLIKIAAERYLKKAEILSVPSHIYDDFCSKFPYTETEDQENAIKDVVSDLNSGKPMDRLICGDVGFGKTEVALRAAFICAINGFQVAVIVPTTLLARQHYETFSKRFQDYPLKIAQLSRLVSSKKSLEIKKELADGKIDIIIGTHSLLSKNIEYHNLGMLIIDEEQHFGVSHKEKIKQLQSNVHILTLTATPIPRTLQMSLTGIRELSVITTPPVDRIAVRTFVLPFDPVVIKDAILRERSRGGQIFYVCPKISDLPNVKKILNEIIPDLKLIEAHGQMASNELENIMSDFLDKKYDLLLATTIIESGLDIPNVNTIIIHKSNMFGLSQLYQLRGRVGRGKNRGYAYLTIPSNQTINDVAMKRLNFMQKMDTLGAGFNLASYDLDIRGAGNLLGEEQSGHIKEVGIELYQKMLEDAINVIKNCNKEAEISDNYWSPQISTGVSVLIPENYIPDLGIRMGIYKRLADIQDVSEINNLKFEMENRFGKIPKEFENLIEVIIIKIECKKINIEKIEAGTNGALITFHNNLFANPAGLIKFITLNNKKISVRSDQKILCLQKWDEPEKQLRGIQQIVSILSKISSEKSK